MSDLDRPKLALYVALALVVCVLGARYLHGQSAGPTAQLGGVGGSATAPRVGGGSAGSPPVAGSTTVRVDQAGGGRVTVDVAGAVRRPGVYRLAAGARVDDALRRAGGPKPGADLTAVNRAATLEDGRQVVVPLRAAAAPAAIAGGPPGVGGASAGAAGSDASAGGGAAAPAAPINLNTATLAQFDTLDGVGPGIAQRIIDYREQHGGFRNVDELGEVPGIGDKRLAALRPRVTV